MPWNSSWYVMITMDRSVAKYNRSMQSLGQIDPLGLSLLRLWNPLSAIDFVANVNAQQKRFSYFFGGQEWRGLGHDLYDGRALLLHQNLASSFSWIIYPLKCGLLSLLYFCIRTHDSYSGLNFRKYSNRKTSWYSLRQKWKNWTRQNGRCCWRYDTDFLPVAFFSLCTSVVFILIFLWTYRISINWTSGHSTTPQFQQAVHH